MTATTTTKPINTTTDDFTLDIERYDEPCPEGRHPARLVDIVDVGEETSEFDGKQRTAHKLWLVWQVFPVYEDNDEIMRQSTGIPFKADKKYTRSLFPGNNSVPASALYTDVDAWTDGALSGGKLARFSLNDLYKLPCHLTIEHKMSGNNVYVNITAIEPCDGASAPEADRAAYARSDYSKRKPKARQEQSLSAPPFVGSGGYQPFATPAAQQKEEEIPF